MEQLKQLTFVVEDDPAIAQLLRIHLSELGLEVDVFHESETAYVAMQTRPYVLGLIDWMLPGVQGIDFIKKIRAKNSTIKLLMLTAKSDSDSIVSGIESGADDYMTKPFDERVLLARVRNLLRRINVDEPKFNKLDGLAINFDSYAVEIEGRDIHLTLSEFKLLAALFKSQGKVLTREQLVGQIQGDDVNVTGRTIDTHIFALRKKLGGWSEHVETIRGVGYRLLASTLDRTVDTP